MDRIDPTNLAAAKQQIADAQPAEPQDGPTRDGLDMARIHAKQFVSIIADEYKGDRTAVIGFTVSYFQNLKELIDAGIEAM
jgi:hypothetical protein